jgi:phosphate transport system permease protein
MTTLLTPRPEDTAAGSRVADVPVPLKPARTRQDKIFMLCLTGASMIVLLAIAAIAAFLLKSSIPAAKYGKGTIITSDHFAPTGAHPSFGMLGILQGTVTIAFGALIIALPISIALALMINEYAPRWAKRTLTSIIDLLAVLPSILYGLWGLLVLSPEIDGPTRWIAAHLSFIPIFRVPAGAPIGNSIFICGIVVGVMCIPILTSVSREVMSQAPRDVCEAALALGGTKWGTITDVILPFARNGIVGGTLLALGRALGETVGVLLILSQTNTIHWQVLIPGGGQIPALIAQDFQTVPPLSQSALTLAGLLLFTTILLLNILARRVVMRASQAAYT